MANLRKRKRNWYADFYDRLRVPNRKEVPLRTSDKTAANARMVELERKYARGEFDPWADRVPETGVTVKDAVARYLKSRGSRRKDTRDTDRVVLERFVGSLPPGALVEQVAARDVAAYVDAPKKDGKPKATATRESYLARVKTFFSWCASSGLRRAGNPADDVERRRVGKKDPLYLSKKEYAKLLKTIEDAAASQPGLKDGEVRWLADVVRVTTGTGLRASELCHLRWSGVDLDGQMLTVRVTGEFKTKSGHERSVPLAGDALETLRRLDRQRESRADGYVFGGRATRKGVRPHLDRQYLNKRFKHYADLAGIRPEHTFHSLRRTYASWLVQGGTDLYVVQKLLGHADIKTTMKYAFLAPDNFRAAVGRVFG